MGTFRIYLPIERAHAGTRLEYRFFLPMGTWAGNFLKSCRRNLFIKTLLPANEQENKIISLQRLFSTFYPPTRPNTRKPICPNGFFMGTFYGQVKMTRAHAPITRAQTLPKSFHHKNTDEIHPTGISSTTPTQLPHFTVKTRTKSRTHFIRKTRSKK